MQKSRTGNREAKKPKKALPPKPLPGRAQAAAIELPAAPVRFKK